MKILLKNPPIELQVLTMIAMILLVFLVAPVVVTTVRAAQAGDSYMRLSRMKASTAPGNILVVFTTSSESQTEGKFKMTFDSEYTAVSATNGDWTYTTTGIPGTSTAMPISGSNGTVSGNTVSYALTGALSASTEYAFFLTGGITSNPAASTSIIHTLFSTTGGDSTIDTTQVAVPVIANDQISVTATVPPSFTFVFGGNTDALGTLTTASVNSGSGNTVTITTNASNGWYAWGLSANAGLTSAVQSYTVNTAGTVNGTPSSLSGGTEGYVLDVDKTTDAGGGGTVTVAAEYNGSDTSSGGTLSTSFQQLASSNGTANGDVLTLIPRVAIAGQTPAANDYTDTLTVVGAGVF